MRSHVKASSAGPTLRRGKQASALTLAIALLGLLVFLVASASAAKEALFYIGNTSGSGTLGGQFNNPRGTAVNSSGAGGVAAGTIYVADDDNHRVERFTPSGDFVSAWGADTIQPGKAGDQVGTDPFEICTAAADCQSGVATGGNGSTTGNGSLDNPQAVAVDTDTGDVYVSDRDNLRINQYTATGTFVRSFGWDVDATEATTTYEVCPAANVCKVGVAGSGAGQIGSTGTSGTLGIAVSPPDGNPGTGTVFLADSQNQRVNTYNLDGTSPSSFGSSTNFGGNQPRQIAADSRGIVYASNSNNGAEIERYDSLNANGGGVGFLPPILPTIPEANERQTVNFSGFEENEDYTLTCPNGETTDPINFTFSAETRYQFMEEALQAKCGSAFNVATDTITFLGDFAETNVPTTVCTPLIGTGTCPVTVVNHGQPEVPNALLPGESNATVGLAVSPDSDGGGSDENVLYVLRDPSQGSTVVQQFGLANDPGNTLAPTADDDVHGASAGFGSVQGLGLDDSTGALYLSATGSVPNVGEGHRVYVLKDTGTIPAPVAVINPVTTKTDTTANFSGTVDPKGGNVVCKFQYATDPDFGGATNVPAPACQSLIPGGGAQAVSVNASGLIPNTEYFVRLVATRAFIPSISATSGQAPFSTDAMPPSVDEVGAVQVEDTSARFVGTINPNNGSTGYVFEYGPTPALGSSTPPLAIGDGATPVVVSQVVSGLAKDTTYYLRLTATNGSGSTSSTQATLHTRSEAAPLPADRAYEQVSPVDKNFGNAVPSSSTLTPATEYVALDGQAVVYGSPNAFGDPPAQILRNMATYISRRQGDSWHTQSVFPNTCAADANNTQFFQFGGWIEKPAPISANAERAVIPQREFAGCATPPLDPAAPLPATNLYRVTFDDDPLSYDLIVPDFEVPPSEAHILDMPGEYVGASDDFSHVYYGAGEGNGLYPKLYEWDNGVLRLASVDPSGSPFSGKSMLASPSSPLQNRSDAVNSVSSDGSRIFFENPGIFSPFGPFGDIYMRQSGVATYNVSESECTVSCGPAQRKKQFEWASVDGEVATFATDQRLLDADTQNPVSDLYAYRHSPNPTAEPNLTMLTLDKEPADGMTPGFQEVLGMSDDGSTVYFIANGQLVPGKPTATGPKIYRWSWNEGTPSLQYLASATNDAQSSTVLNEIEHWERRVTRSGDALMVEAKAEIDPVADHDDDIDVYLWRVGHGWTCVSCQAPGDASGGKSTTGRVGPTKTDLSFTERPVARELVTAMSEDGESVFFQTQDALVPADTNGPCSFASDLGFFPCTDIYEWHDGRVSLITRGIGSSDLGLLGTSESGDDVLFYSAARLVGWDKDDLIDVYDARVGGGLPEPPDQPAVCEGESCRGASSRAPESSGAGTAVFQGPGNPTADSTRKTCPKGKRKVRRGGKTRCVKPRPARKRNRATNSNRRAAR